ncbi:hypothetical protein BDV18DRAFT_155290 [Aspergillus unguis]
MGEGEVEAEAEEERMGRKGVVLHEDAIGAPTNSVVTTRELVAGLHQIDLDRDAIGQEGNTFESYATRLIAAVITQIFSYMIDSGTRYGYICTGEAFVFLQIPKDDPTTVEYYLSIPNQDVQADDELHIQRTAIGQVLAFTLQALTADAPSQQWHDAAREKL